MTNEKVKLKVAGQHYKYSLETRLGCDQQDRRGLTVQQGLPRKWFIFKVLNNALDALQAVMKQPVNRFATTCQINNVYPSFNNML